MKLVRQQIPKSEAIQAINRMASTEDGKIFLAYLCQHCGFLNNTMSMDDPNKTQALAAIRGVYAAMRKSVKPEHLLQIEYGISIINDPINKGKKNVGDSTSSK